MTQITMTTHCGYVAIVGHPNAGKSTLLNHLIGYRLSAIANKPQTTRINVRGILTENNYQIIFIDTPGIHQRAGSLLSKSLNNEAVSALEGVDVIIMIVEVNKWSGEDNLVLQRIKEVNKPTLLLINKVDTLANKESVLAYMDEVQKKHVFTEIIPISATKGINTKAMLAKIINLIPSGPFIYPKEWVTDQPTKFICTELIREQLVKNLHQEIPYTTAVEIEEFHETKKIIHINATIWVSRQGQKGIIIGKQGETLKRIGSGARYVLEEFLMSKVMLKLWVKVVEDWQNKPKYINELNQAAQRTHYT